MSKENWFDWSEYQRGAKKKGAGSYGSAMRKSAVNVASGKKTQQGGKKFPASIQKVAAAMAKKYNTRGTLRKGVVRNASAAQMLQAAPR